MDELMGADTKDVKIDFGFIAKEPRVVERCKAICTEFGYTWKHWETLEQFVESGLECGMVLGHIPPEASDQLAAEFAQGVRFVCKDAFVICAVGEALGKDKAGFIKKSGANLILLEDELFNTSKVEFIATQTLKAGYFPIKVSDLFAGKELHFDVYHLLTQRKKFLKSAFKGDVLTEEKIKKFAAVGELYIQRGEIDGFNKYVKENVDRSREGLARRCRGMYLSLYAGYANLILLLTDQSERTSYTEGLALLKKVEDSSDELIALIAEFGNAWEIINQSSIGEFGSIERAPAVAAHAALFALEVGSKRTRDIMLSALLSDIGLVFLPPAVTKMVREDQVEKLDKEQTAIYRAYPQKSLDMILDRKLPLDQKLREFLISTRERADGKGFPRGTSGPSIPEEAQIIYFCRELDRRTVLRMGQQRVNPEEVRKDLIREQIKTLELFSPGFLMKLKKTFIDGNA